jgi:uncharacterized membrane protein YgcG
LKVGDPALPAPRREGRGRKQSEGRRVLENVIRTPNNRRLLGALGAIAILCSAALPAFARDAFVQDGASLFSQSTVTALNREIGDFNRRTGKEIVVVTVPSLDGRTIQDAAERSFAQQQVNGVLFYLAKTERQDGIVPDRMAAQFFPQGTFANIRQAMRGYFRAGDFDTGITTGVNLVLDQYRSHERALGGASQRAVPSTNSQSFGGAMSLFWLALILLAGFLIIRAIFRAMSGPRIMPPGYGPGPGSGSGPGFGGGPGYGYGGGGGGGGFFSGLLGGLGGAFLGNELFGRHDATTSIQNPAGIVPGDPGSTGDASGWQSDPGQADMSNASFGDFGSSGGGFDGGGGGGDSGGGFDGGGGGGDSGGGW